VELVAADLGGVREAVEAVIDVVVGRARRVVELVGELRQVRVFFAIASASCAGAARPGAGPLTLVPGGRRIRPLNVWFVNSSETC
jgi:hypothetical protein